jgi:bifunctional non-homologous end joining protein LigD
MLATAVRGLPRSSEFVFETKWDGFRAVLFVEEGGYRIVSRKRTDMTAWFPELALAASQIAARTAIVDGEIVSRDGSVESFNELLKIGRRHQESVRES